MTSGLLGGLGGSSGVGTVFNERLAAVQAATTPMGKLQALLQTIGIRFRTAGGTSTGVSLQATYVSTPTGSGTFQVTVNFAGTLKSSAGAVLAGQPMTLTVAGTNVATATTSSAGAFSGTFSFTGTQGTDTLTASYAGGTISGQPYAASSGTTTFTVGSPATVGTTTTVETS